MNRLPDVDRIARESGARLWDRRDLLRLIAGGAGAGALGVLGGGAPAAAVARGGQAASGSQVSLLWRTPTTLGPLFSTAASEQQVERLMFGSLIKVNGALQPIPDLPESVDVSEDARVYTFNLRRDIRFNDGQPLTAADVVFTIERAVDKRTASFWRGRLLGISGAEAFGDQQAETISGLETPDEYTVRMTLDEPDSAFLVNLADFSGLGILPRHVLQDVAPDQLINHPFNLDPSVTAGAYELVDYQPDQFMELGRSETYWGDPPAIERIFLRILEPDIAVAELEKGTLDVMAISVDDVERLSAVPTLNVVSGANLGMDSITFNLDRPYLQDKRVRQAVMHAIDRETIVESLYQGQAVVVNSPIFGPEWMGIPEGLNPYPYDPEKARQLLAEAGWDASRSLELMWVPGGNRIFDTMVSVVQSQLAEVGITVELLQLEPPELIRKLIQDIDFDLSIGGGGVYGADPSISAKYYDSANLTPGGGNSGRYVNPEVDRLYAEGRAAGSLEERKVIYTELAQILNEDVASVFLWSPKTIFAVNTRLQGFDPPGHPFVYLHNAESWTLADA